MLTLNDVLTEGVRPVADVQELRILLVREANLHRLDVVHALGQLAYHRRDLSNLVILLREGLDVLEQIDDLIDRLDFLVQFTLDRLDFLLDIFLLGGEVLLDIGLSPNKKLLPAGFIV